MKATTKTELWNGYKIRFVESNGEWWAVAVDVCAALGLKQVTRALGRLKDGVTFSKVIDPLGREQDTNILNEKAIYRLAFGSRKPEAGAFQDWVFEMLRQLRKQTGLEGFEVFRMLDKEHQKAALKRLQDGLNKPTQKDFIKANTIANKAVSDRYGCPRMLKKAEMSPDMLAERERILEDTVTLMALNDRYGLNLSVGSRIYQTKEKAG